MPLAAEVHRFARRVPSLLVVLALAVPVFLLTNPSFVPVEARASLDGIAATQLFTLNTAEPLLLEIEYAVRPPDQGAANQAPAAVVLTLNGTQVARLETAQLYIVNRAMPLAPVTTVRAGENRLDITLDGPPASTFDVTLRVHNYRGINPRFPRLFVVPDAAVGHFVAQTSVLGHLLRLGVVYLLSLAVVWGTALLSRRRSRTGAFVLLLSPSVLLWATALYSLASPLHIWLSTGAVLVLMLVGSLAGAGVLWVHARHRTVAMAAAVATVVLVACETGLRLFNLLVPSPIFYSDSYSRYRGRPGAPFLGSELNSLGFNDVEHRPTRPSNVRYRITALGDSIAFGVVPYKDNYLTLLESALASSGPVEVVNMGVPGTGPNDYLSLLVAEGLAFEPDLVLVSVFIGNDFESATRQPYERSYLATATYYFWTLLTAGAPTETLFQASGQAYTDDAPTFAPDRFLEIEVDRAWIYATGDTRLGDAVTTVVTALREIRDVAARAGAATLIVLVPDEVQVDGDLADRVAQAAGDARGPLDFRRPNAALTEALASEGIPSHDLLPLFGQASTRGPLYKPRDTHWNLAGNRLAADAIAQVVRERIAEGR